MARYVALSGLALIVSLSPAAAPHAQEPVLPARTAETHAMDGLLGRWDIVEKVHNPRYPRIKGTWVFNRSGDGFMVVDEFRLFNGLGQTAYIAETYRAFDPVKKTWTFRATTFQSPMLSPESGHWDAGVTKVAANEIIDESAKESTITRARIYNIKPDSFSCIVEKSGDNGKTWVTPFQIEAVRAKESGRRDDVNHGRSHGPR